MSETRSRLIALIDSARIDLERNPKVMSISDLARAAGISRATIYRYYPDVVSYLKSVSGKVEDVRVKGQQVKNSLLKAQLSKQKDLVKALARACSELIAEVAELKATYSDQLEAKELKIKYLENSLREMGVAKPRLVK